MATFQISKSELLSRLQSVSKIISAKPALPVMETILFSLKDGKLHLSAADYSGRINTSIDGVLADNDISICIDAKKVIEALSTLPEQPITISINENNFSVVIKYQGGKFELMGCPPEGFPVEKNIIDATSVSIPISTFLDGISKTLLCVADDELRPVMNGIYIEMSDNFLNFVASDGHKLALVEYEFAVLDKISFILPSKIASILRKAIPQKEETITLLVGTNNARFTFGSYTVVAQLIEGNYPNYRSVIPTNNEKKMTITASALKSALSRVMVFANESSKLVKFNLDLDTLSITAQDIDYSTSADEKIACEYPDSKMQIGFNGGFLHQLISSVGTDELTMSFSEPSRAALVIPSDNKEGCNLVYLLMPAMLND